jgi:hypothetical protein
MAMEMQTYDISVLAAYSCATVYVCSIRNFLGGYQTYASSRVMTRSQTVQVLLYHRLNYTSDITMRPSTCYTWIRYGLLCGRL